MICIVNIVIWQHSDVWDLARKLKFRQRHAKWDSNTMWKSDHVKATRSTVHTLFLKHLDEEKAAYFSLRN